jgi:uncharacterized membrane protein
MRKYNFPFVLFIFGLIVTIFGMMSLDNFNGIFEKILTFFFVPGHTHSAWILLFINLGMYIIHAGFLIALIISFKSLKNSPVGIDKTVFRISLVFITGVLLLWFFNGSYPVFYNTWALINNALIKTAPTDMGTLF